MLAEAMMTVKPKVGPNFKDHVGKTNSVGTKVIGYFHELHFNNRQFICECKCGIEYLGVSHKIFDGAHESCEECRKHRKRTVNLVGTTFGYGCTVLSEIDAEENLGTGKKRTYNVKCHCGREWVLPQDHIQRPINECRKCSTKTSAVGISGENHWNYNSSLTDEERRDNRRHAVNRQLLQQIKERDGFQCILSGLSDNLVVHHLQGWDNHPELRDDPSNLVTLDYDVHEHFHSIYGKGGNTKTQFLQFVSDYYPNKLDLIRCLGKS